jgi:hypothetical protein
MIPRKVTTLLTLFAFATAGANSALAEGRGVRDPLHGRGDSSLHRTGYHWKRPPVITGGFVGIDGYGSDGGYGNGGVTGNGYGDWYGISSGHNECTLFRQRVLTPQGWQVQMVPVC